ncbi:MAG TPA: hypothetical protein VJB99_00130 [Patescibacteria group bacterium]|nr:hypothetical protein [Patescibacteria group bacterium]
MRKSCFLLLLLTGCYLPPPDISSEVLEEEVGETCGISPPFLGGDSVFFFGATDEGVAEAANVGCVAGNLEGDAGVSLALLLGFPKEEDPFLDMEGKAQEEFCTPSLLTDCVSHIGDGNGLKLSVNWCVGSEHDFTVVGVSATVSGKSVSFWGTCEDECGVLSASFFNGTPEEGGVSIENISSLPKLGEGEMLKCQ